MKVTIETDYLKDLDAMAVIILGYLEEMPEAVLTEMTEDLSRSSGNLQQQVKKLERWGYIKRKFGPNRRGLRSGRQRMIGADILK